MNFHQCKEEKGDIVFQETGKYFKTMEAPPPALYRVYNAGNMLTGFIPFFEKQEKGDALIEFESGIMKDIVDKLDKFFSEDTTKKYKELGMIHKMGIILYGKPGVGKTALAKLAMLKAVAKYGAICLDFTRFGVDIIKFVCDLLRQYTKAPLICFVDECEGMLKAEGMLTFLDGGDSIEDCIFIGATNNHKKIPNRIINRKSRIKFAWDIHSLPDEVYKQYIKEKIPSIESKPHVEFAFRAAEARLTIDQLKNALINYYIDGMSIEEAIEEVQSSVETTPPKEGEETW